jgi:hypothetical protein
VAREEFLQDTITTRRLTHIDTVVYPVVRPSPTLAYSTLWHPNGRGLQSTPLKQSKDPLEYHGVLLLLYYIPHARNLHNTEPLALTIWCSQRSTEVRLGWATHTRHKIRAQHTHTSHNLSSQHNPKSSYSNGALVAITKNRMRRFGVLVLRNALENA